MSDDGGIGIWRGLTTDKRAEGTMEEFTLGNPSIQAVDEGKFCRKGEKGDFVILWRKSNLTKTRLSKSYYGIQ